MTGIRLLPHQKACLDQLEGKNRVAIYHDMGLGKTFTGAEKMVSLGSRVNLVVCQKSKVQDWIDHFKEHYDIVPFDLTKKGRLEGFLRWRDGQPEHIHVRQCVGIVNYDLVFRRPELLKLESFTLMLDESSLICNEAAKRSRAILRMRPANVILLSGTPTSGRYEKLWSQCRLLGWDIGKQVFWNSYIVTEWRDYAGFLQKVVVGYKNVDHLKRKLAEHGAVFLKTSEVMDLPDQVEQEVRLEPTREYKRFHRESYLEMEDGTVLAGDSMLAKISYERQLCGQYHGGKLAAFRDILDSTEENLVVFYNFNAELDAMDRIARDAGRVPGVVNGDRKDRPDGHDILFVQYMAGAYGLNLQGFSHIIIYFSLPLGRGSCDLWEQSKKRIHRIGQDRACFYYYLLVKDSIEVRNLKALKEGKDYTDYLFEKEEP